MNSNDFTVSFLVDKTPNEAFNTINDVRAWWSDDFDGRSQKLNDEFTVVFDDMHRSTQKLTEVVPGKKVVWFVTDSCLSFLNDKTEWTGTTIVFDISAKDGKTQIHFTHVGLTPQSECFRDCLMGWNYYLNSLVTLITTGEGQPNLIK